MCVPVEHGAAACYLFTLVILCVSSGTRKSPLGLVGFVSFRGLAGERSNWNVFPVSAFGLITPPPWPQPPEVWSRAQTRD